MLNFNCLLGADKWVGDWFNDRKTLSVVNTDCVIECSDVTSDQSDLTISWYIGMHECNVLISWLSPAAGQSVDHASVGVGYLMLTYFRHWVEI